MESMRWSSFALCRSWLDRAQVCSAEMQAVLEEVEMVGVGGQELVEYRVRFVEERKAKGWS